MIEIAIQAGQKCTLNKPLYCPKKGEHLNPKLYHRQGYLPYKK
jgi:hypothetical protein